MKRTVLLVVAVLFFAVEAVAKPSHIVIVSHSVSSCTYDPGIAQGPCYADWLRRLMRVTNISLGGATAMEWANQPLPPMLFSSFPNTWGVIGLGGNDAVFQIDPAVFQSRIAGIAVNMLFLGAERVVLLLFPTDTGFKFTYELRDLYVQVQLELCESSALVYCVDLRDMPRMYFENGSVHPNAAGQEWLAVMIYLRLP